MVKVHLALFIGFVAASVVSCGFADEKKWTEGESLAAEVNQALRKYLTENFGPGALPTGQALSFEQFREHLKIDEESIAEWTRNFSLQDVSITLGEDAGPSTSFTITVNGRGHGNSNSEAPRGKLIMERGAETKITN